MQPSWKRVVPPLLFAFGCAVASAQTYQDTSGTIVSGVVPLPFPYTPVAPGQHNLSLTSATALQVPAGARYAIVCASNAKVFYTTDGVTTPTTSLGMPLSAGACFTLSGSLALANFRAASAAGALDVEYFK